MTDTVLTSIISASAAVSTAVVALVLNYRGFVTIESRMNSLDSRMTGMENRIHADIQSLTSKVIEVDNRLTRLEERIGPPR
jgi:uncharacterized membrane protein YfbV (UPF0208 family)